MKIHFINIDNIGEYINIHGINSISGEFKVIPIKVQFQVEHSGKLWTALGYDTSKMRYIWPVEEFIARWEPWLTTAEIKTLKHLNPTGQTEGVNPNGVPEDLVERRHG